MRLRALLPDLFACDTLGEGFRAVVLALLYSLINLNGILLSQDQFVRVKEALETLKKTPYLEIEIALEIHELLEGCGLCPDPKDMDELTEIISDALEDSDTSGQIAAG